MITLSKHVITILITAILGFAVYSFVDSFSLSKKLNYYKHANQLISETFSKSDLVNDDYERRMHESIRSIKNGGLKNEEINYINDHSNSYNISKRVL